MNLRYLIVLLAAGAAVALPLEAELHGQASAWLAGGRDTALFGQAGLRYLPEARLSVPLGGQFTFDAEGSVNGSVAADARAFDRPEVKAQVRPYRLLARLSADRFEARVGLQKLNFGSATLLRPLQWFDRLDPRDPLGLTDGVFGLLVRAYPWGNANVWAWGLLGNHETKGQELLPTARWKPEPGGRVQLPVTRGEVALTYHHRVVDLSEVARVPEVLPEQYEDRLGLDAKADIGIGLWVEGMLGRQTLRMSEGEGTPVWTRVGAVGADYTFGVGNGLGVLAEHMTAGGAAKEPFADGEDRQFSTLLLSYPLGLLDNLRGVVLYDWSGRGLYRFVSWQRTLDNWLFSVAAFWNPDAPARFGAGAGAAGKGVQLTVAFNH